MWHFLSYLRNYKAYEDEISDLQLEKYGLSFMTKKYTTSGWALGDENDLIQWSHCHEFTQYRFDSVVHHDLLLLPLLQLEKVRLHA